MLLDSSAGFEATVAPAQGRMATACFRFADSNLGFSEGALALLLRAVEGDPVKARAQWWDGVRACRRRRKGPWLGFPVGRALTLPHLPALLETRALRFRINCVINRHGPSSSAHVAS